MEYLQYLKLENKRKVELTRGFKPCYKWNTFNTMAKENVKVEEILDEVLNLVINGIPSIQNGQLFDVGYQYCFKPCYKWNTFNTRK